MTNRLVIDSANLAGNQRHNGEIQSVNANFILHHFRFHLEPKSPLHMPAYNRDNVIRGGFGSTFRLSADRQGGLSVMRTAGCRRLANYGLIATNILVQAYAVSKGLKGRSPRRSYGKT
jgi:hypothetical protein